ncbi:hypothetical protein N7447_008784 [Penicillium robsamsonii]|uniref:uncharacterized protein n=1 Tax=Penicillium robsamsonii TaxID=1792511 RepID=UPI0025493487|nr:uncharacterized protein N7447_008784 [Penicillium robsamsonii]KAJ5816551.1 hypothetical protein N7447_008784 [Penicillium robsamsonii]
MAQVSFYDINMGYYIKPLKLISPDSAEPKPDSTYQPMEARPNEACDDTFRPVLAGEFTMAPALPETMFEGLRLCGDCQGGKKEVGSHTLGNSALG